MPPARPGTGSTTGRLNTSGGAVGGGGTIGESVQEEILTARATINEHYSTFDAELAERLPSSNVALPSMPLRSSSNHRPSTGQAMRPQGSASSASAKRNMTRVNLRGVPRSAVGIHVVGGNHEATTTHGVDLAAGIFFAPPPGGKPSTVDEVLAPFASQQAKQRQRIEDEIRSWQLHAVAAKEQFQSISQWAYQSLDHAIERDSHERGKNSIPSKFRVTAISMVLINVLQAFCPDNVLCGRLLDEVLSLIFADWEPGQAAKKPFPNDALAESAGYLEELDAIRGSMTQMRQAHDANATSMKHFRTVSQRLVNKAHLESVRVMFRCWRMLTRRRKKSLSFLTSRRTTTLRRETLAEHFSQWKRCTQASKIALLAANAEASRSQVAELTKKIAIAVTAGRNEVEQELAVVKTKLYEEMELRETQLSAFTTEIDDLAVQLSVGRKLMCCLSMERNLWRSLWLTHHRETALPDKCASVMMLENGRIQDSMRALHAAEAAFIENQSNVGVRRRSSAGANTSIADAQPPAISSEGSSSAANPVATPAPLLSSSVGQVMAPSIPAPLSVSSFDDSLPRMQRARFVLRQSVESLLTMWTNAVLSKLGSGRILLSLKDDLADGEIFAGLCYALERPAPAFEFVGNSLTPGVNGKTLLDTVKLCVQRSVACPGHQPLLTHCPYYADRLDETNILFSAGDDASSNWHVWLLATLFTDYCWQQLCNVDEADPHIQLDDWNVLSCNTSRHKSAAESTSTTLGTSERPSGGLGDADEITNRMIVAEKVVRREKQLSTSSRRLAPGGPRRPSHLSGQLVRSSSTVANPMAGNKSGSPLRRESHRGSVAGPPSAQGTLPSTRSTIGTIRRGSVSSFAGARSSISRDGGGPDTNSSSFGQQQRSSVTSIVSGGAPPPPPPVPSSQAHRPSVVFQSPVEGAQQPSATSGTHPQAAAERRARKQSTAPAKSAVPPPVDRDGDSNDSSESDVDDGFVEDDFITPANAALQRGSSKASAALASSSKQQEDTAADDVLKDALSDAMDNCAAYFHHLRRGEEWKGAAHRAALYLRRECHPHSDDIIKEREVACRGECALFSEIQERCRAELGARHHASIASTYDACRTYALHKESVDRKRAWHDLCQQVTQAIVVFRCLDAAQPASPTRAKTQLAASFQF